MDGAGMERETGSDDRVKNAGPGEVLELMMLRNGVPGRGYRMAPPARAGPLEAACTAPSPVQPCCEHSLISRLDLGRLAAPRPAVCCSLACAHLLPPQCRQLWLE